MHVLLHGNQRPARGGGISPQLIGRLEALIKMAQAEPIERVYFFADDRYPDGSTAAEYVEDRLTQLGFGPEALTIDPVARDTQKEVRAFIERRAGYGHRGPVRAVTSFYHARRCEFLLRQGGCYPQMVVARQFSLADLMLEPLKVVLERSGYGARIKGTLRRSRDRSTLVA